MRKGRYAVAIVFALLLSLVTQINPPVIAAGNGVETRIEQLKQEFPEGVYFTTDGKKDSPGDLMSMLKSRGMSTKGFDQSYTCIAFVKFAWGRVFGHSVTSQRKDVAGSAKNNLSVHDESIWDRAKIGDLVYFYDSATASGAGHGAIFLKKSGNTISLVDNNYHNDNRIKYYTVKCGVNNWWPRQYCRIFRATNYDEVNGSACYTVTFDPNGGTVSQKSKQVVAGESIGAVPKATRQGYTFMGWAYSKDESKIGLLVTDNSVYINGDTTLYAYWKEDKTKDPPVKNISEGWYTLAPKCAPNSRLDVWHRSTADKANVHIWSQASSNTQAFYISKNSDGTYKIATANSGKVIDVDNAGTAKGTNVWQYKDNGTNAQKWIFQDAGDGYVYIVPKVSFSLRLDVDNKGSADGTNVQVWTANSSDAQKWKLTATSAPTVKACTIHTKGSYVTFEVAHPHKDIYKCSVCGEQYAVAGTSNYYKDCGICKPADYTVFFDGNGGSVSPSSKTVTDGETYGSLPTPQRNGYDFEGWYTRADDLGFRVYSSTTVDLVGDLKLYAHWSKVSEPEVCTSHTKGSYITYEDAHPHRDIYRCSMCGERYSVSGTSNYDSSCTICNPPREPVWGSWSSWQTGKVSESSTRQVETRQVEVAPARTEYRYGRWVNSEPYDHYCPIAAVNGGHRNDYHLDYTAWSTTRLSRYDKGWICADRSHGSYHVGCTERDWNYNGKKVDLWKYSYKTSANATADYYWEETRTVPATYETQYRYRDLVAGG